MRSGAKTSSGEREQKVSVSCPSDSPLLDCIKLNSTSRCRRVGERSLPTACRRALWCSPSSSSHLKWIGSTFLPACQHKERQTRSKNMRWRLFASWFIHLLSPALQHWYGNQRYNKQRLNYTLCFFLLLLPMQIKPPPLSLAEGLITFGDIFFFGLSSLPSLWI